MDTLRRHTTVIDNLILFSLSVLIIGLPFSNSIIEITATIAILLWVFKKVFILRSFKVEKTPLNWPILFYLIFVVLSLFNSQFFMTSLRGFVRKTLEYIALYFVIVESMNTRRDFRILISAILLSCALIGIDSVWQYVTGYDFLRGYPLFSLKRVAASFKFPNGFAAWLITVMPLCISLAIFNTKEKLYKVSGAFLCVLLSACLVLTFNKSAWLAIIFAIIFLAWRRGDVAKKVLLFFLLIAILGAGIITVFGDKEFISFYIVKDNSAFYRIVLAKLCWDMFIDHPFIGHGINVFMSIFKNYSSLPKFSQIAYAHNCYFQIAVETGIFGLLTFLWMVGALFVSSLRDINRKKEGLIKAGKIGLLAGLLAYLLHSAFETNLYSLRLAVLFYYFLGVTIGIEKVEEP